MGFDAFMDKEYKKRFKYKSLYDRWGSEKKLVHIIKFLKQCVDEIESEMEYLHTATGKRDEALVAEWKVRTQEKLDKLTKVLDDIL